MHTLLRLPLILLELALRQGAGVVMDILRRAAGGGEDERAPPSAPTPWPRAARPRSSEPRRRGRGAPRHARATRPAAPGPGPGAGSRARGRAAGARVDRRRDRRVVRARRRPSPAFNVQAPWDGYDGHPAAEIIKRVRAADEATRAVVLLYERGHKGRASVIRAAGGERATP